MRSVLEVQQSAGLGTVFRENATASSKQFQPFKKIKHNANRISISLKQANYTKTEHKEKISPKVAIHTTKYKPKKQ